MDAPADWAEPHNPEIEGALLGAMLAANHTFDQVGDFLLPEHFYEPVHGRIFEAIAKRIERGERVTPSVLMEFADDPYLKDHGGQQYLYDLVANVISTTPATVRGYGEIVRDLFLRRELISNCRNAIAAASEHDGTTTAKEIVEAHEEALYGVTRARVEVSIVTAAGAFDELLLRTDAAMKRDTKVIGVPTGLAGLDEALGGLQDSKLIVVGSRPSMGKTALACNVVWNAANDGYACAMFSQEMSDYQIASRWAARETGLSVAAISNGNISIEQFQQIDQVRHDIAANIRLHVDDSGKISVAQIRSRVRRLLRKGLDLVVIDYLGLIEPTQYAKRSNRTEQVSEITRELKQMTQDFDIPIVLLAQLNRDLERRDNKRPLLSDLRESGSVEQDADTVIFLYRPEYYLAKDEPVQGAKEKSFEFDERRATWHASLQNAAGVCEAIIAKNRQGPVKTVHLHFDGATNTMMDHRPLNDDPMVRELEL